MSLSIRLAARIFNTPLLITPDKLEAIMSVISRGDVITSVEASQVAVTAGIADARKPNFAPKGIACISVIGSLVSRSSGFNGGSGLRSYASIKQDLTAAMHDPDIGGVMLDVDSHGGEVSGLFDLCDHIRACNEVKPVYGFANESAYSAGYAILSSAAKVYATNTSGGGSVGVIMQHLDQSEKNKKEGVCVEYIFSGKKKADGNPNEPLSESVRSELQSRVDTLRAMFADRVDNARNLKPGTALKTEAGVFMGEELVTVGFVDAIATWDEALNELSAKINTNNGGSKMTTQERMAALIANNTDAPEALATLGYILATHAESHLKQQLDKMEADIFASTTAATLEYASQVCTLCELAGMSSKMASEMIKDGISLEEAQVIVLEGKAAKDASTPVKSTLSGEVKKSNTFLSHLAKSYGVATV